MKIIAVILLIVGAVVGGLAAYAYFFTADIENCERSSALAEEKLREAQGAMGTPREAALMKEVRLEVDSAERACRQARQTRQSALFAGLGGLVPLILSAVLLRISRKRRAGSGPQIVSYEPSRLEQPLEPNAR